MSSRFELVILWFEKICDCGHVNLQDVNLKVDLKIFGSCIPTNESLFILLALPTLAQTVQDMYSSDAVFHVRAEKFNSIYK